MRIILLILLAITGSVIKPQIIVGYYYGNYSGYPHNLIDYSCLTHVAHAFIFPDSNGTFHYPEWFPYPDLIKTTHENGRKIVVSIGGWGNSEGFRPMAADSVKRKIFINELVDFIKRHNYDGADIDWEYPKQVDKQNFNSLISEMRAAFDKSGIEILSAALPAMDWNDVFDADFLEDKLSWFGIMTYDFYGPWEKKTGNNTALYSTSRQRLSVDASIKHYLKKGVPQNKLCMGMEFAGYQFNADSLHKFHNGGKSISYNNSLKKILDGWKYNWDNSAKVPYFIQNDSIITIDDTSSIRYKTDYILNQDIAGTIIWKLGLDYINGINELSNIIGDRLLSIPPGTTDIYFPDNNALLDISNVEIKWFRTKAAAYYQVQISESEDFKNISFEERLSSESIVPRSLEPCKIYYCRVRGENLAGEGSWSPVISFSTYNTAGLVSVKNVFNYFPEKFNKEINLLYYSDKTEYGRIILYDIYGAEKEIYSGIIKEGTYSKRLDITDLPAGEYQLRIFNSKDSAAFKLKIDP